MEAFLSSSTLGSFSSPGCQTDPKSVPASAIHPSSLRRTRGADARGAAQIVDRRSGNRRHRPGLDGLSGVEAPVTMTTGESGSWGGADPAETSNPISGHQHIEQDDVRRLALDRAQAPPLPLDAVITSKYSRGDRLQQPHVCGTSSIPEFVPTWSSTAKKRSTVSRAAPRNRQHYGPHPAAFADLLLVALLGESGNHNDRN